jgi:uncharacterized protein (UPF0147 family)
MANRSAIHFQFLPAALIFFGAAFLAASTFASAQNKTNERKPQTPPATVTRPARDENKKPADTTSYTYEFTQPDFMVRHIVIQHDAMGRGKITFQKKGVETAIEEPVELSTGALGRILGAWTDLSFLESTESYQSHLQYPHLGTMRLTMAREPRKRTAEFNWTDNKTASLLATEYRRVADQAVLIFDIAVARESQPLNAPKLMEEFELLLKRNALSDPQQLVPLLNEVSTDEHLPLIARNHALRLIKKLEQ